MYKEMTRILRLFFQKLIKLDDTNDCISKFHFLMPTMKPQISREST